MATQTSTADYLDRIERMTTGSKVVTTSSRNEYKEKYMNMRHGDMLAIAYSIEQTHMEKAELFALIKELAARLELA